MSDLISRFVEEGMMWEAPIKVMQKEVKMQMEGEILKAVQEVGIVVDKEELMKALRYDREQYEKGYADGLKANKWIPGLPEEDGKYLCQSDLNGRAIMEVLCFANNLYKVDKYDFFNCKGKKGFYRYDSEIGYYETIGIIAWMPLPEPYKGE